MNGLSSANAGSGTKMLYHPRFTPESTFLFLLHKSDWRLGVVNSLPISAPAPREFSDRRAYR
jgi:hypothetical protein